MEVLLVPEEYSEDLINYVPCIGPIVVEQGPAPAEGRLSGKHSIVVEQGPAPAVYLVPPDCLDGWSGTLLHHDLIDSGIPYETYGLEQSPALPVTQGQ